MKGLSFKVVGLSLALFLSITYIICIAFDLIWPQFAMYKVWAPLLPGFSWISWTSFFSGIDRIIYLGLLYRYNLCAHL